MTLALSTALRTARAQAIITEAGANAQIRLYSGTRPASGGAAGTLLATLFLVSLGTAANGVLTLGAATQNNANHVAGTPTWGRILKADGSTFVADFSVAASGSDLNFTGTIANGTSITLSGITITEANA